MLVGEVLQPSLAALEALEEGDMNWMQRITSETGFVPARVQAARLVEDGIVDPREAISWFGTLAG